MALANVIPTEGYCFLCGCSQDDACSDDDDTPCSWADAEHMVCSVCFSALGDLAIGWLLDKSGGRV